MSYAIAAAGTGGHVYPGLAVGEALMARAIPPDQILFVGGGRLEAQVYPEAGFPFLGLELRGLQRALTPANLALPRVVWKAAADAAREFRRRGVKAVLAMGGYVTVPVGIAASRVGARLAVAEQNAEAGLANRLMSPLATLRFGAFPFTRGLPGAEWVGNPLRRPFTCFERPLLRTSALERYGLDPDVPVLGVFGGSLGAGALNEAVTEVASAWSGPRMQIVHIAGPAHADGLEEAAARSPVRWRVIGFEERMDLFYAASDLVVGRAGGAVAELTATRTPSILVPGGFGSGRHQAANAAVLERAGAAVVVPEQELDRLGEVAGSLLSDPDRRRRMAEAAASLARPHAAEAVAVAMEHLHG